MSHHRLRFRLVPALALTALAVAGHAADLASLPLGDSSRAFEPVAGEPGEILDLVAPPAGDAGRAIDAATFAQRVAKADVVLIGEEHTSGACHEMQAQMLNAIAATGRPFALGMEFFESADDPALARWVAGKIDTTAMLLETGWYDGGSINFEYYRPLLETARAHGAPVVGLNVPRSVVHAVSHDGWDSLSPADKKLVGPLGRVDARHRFAVDTMMGGFSASMPEMFDGMYRGQTSWDSAMAQSVLRAHSGVAKGRLVVVIVGVGHVGHGLGIPQRLRAASPSLDVRVVAPVSAERAEPDAMVHPGFEAKETATFSRGFGEFAYILPDEGGAEAYPTFGVRLDEPEGTKDVHVASVEAGSVADRAGLAKDDVLVAVSGERLESLSKAKLQLAASRWDGRVELTVRRAGAEIVVPVLMEPATDGPGRWMKSTPASLILDGFDPRATRSYIPAKQPAGATPQARLVRFHDDPVRIDVFDGARLSETWKLDASGRPVLGLLASPASDGAVRVELDRDAAGNVTVERRIDASGKPVEPRPAKVQADGSAH